MKTRITELLNIDYPISKEGWPGLLMVIWQELFLRLED